MKLPSNFIKNSTSKLSTRKSSITKELIQLMHMFFKKLYERKKIVPASAFALQKTLHPKKVNYELDSLEDN